MRLLLDTHIAIWAATDEMMLTPGERSAIAMASTPIVSAVSIWEARLKWHSFHLSGLRKGVIAPGTLLRFIEAMGWILLPLTARHAATELASPLPHRDPFDELLLVQAQVEGMQLLTRDRAFQGQPSARFG